MHKLTLGGLALALSLVAARPATADVRVTMHDGLVTVSAKDATLRQILAEWARVGQTKFVDADRISGGPLTIELTDVPERQALDILLRSVTGYMLVARPTLAPNVSQYDRILVIPAAVQPRTMTAGSSIPPPLPQPRFQLQPLPPEFQESPLQTSDSPNDPQPGRPANQFAPPLQPGVTAQPFQAPNATPAQPGPVGASAPGMIVQPPQTSQPGQVAPTQPPGRF